MADSRDLERRGGGAPKRRFRACGGPQWRGVRYRSSLCLGDIPLLVIASGPDPERGELRGHARGIIAVGDIATGVVALGGLARGLVAALGGLALGAISFGGLSIGALIAVGGLAIGSFAFGGRRHRRRGGRRRGRRVLRVWRRRRGRPRHMARQGRPRGGRAFFERYGLAGVCRGQRRR